MQKKKRRLIVAALILGLTALSVLLSLLLSACAVSVSKYEINSAKLGTKLRIAHLSDLHNSTFGKDNSRLIKKVAAQEPDLIVITGDLLNGGESDTETAVKLVGQLCRTAPVYISFGNHEKDHQKSFGTDLKTLFEAAGAVVLDSEWRDITVNGQSLRIGGIYGYCLPPDMQEAREVESRFLKDFSDTESCKILLCHMPVSWIEYGSLDSWDVDLVLCGHAHGGQARLPFAGGLWAPDQGWFPGRECGLYRSKDGKRVMELSRGLGNAEWLPRLNNTPEIVMLDIAPESN
jgi:predicted MPP superfamily phosphohydrolase